MVGPEYSIQDFLAACSKGEAVLIDDAPNDSRQYFNLKTQGAVLKFIASGGLKKIRHYNTKLWETRPDKNITIMVDAYTFYSGEKCGYIAFLFQPITKKWLIKSFKKNKEVDIRSFPFKDILTKLKK